MTGTALSPRSAGLLNPNHYLAVAINYLFQNRAGWRADAAVGKTLVSSSMIDRVAASLGRRLAEVPVGFKWFVEGLLDGSYGFGGEESAGASFLRQDGTVWTTDKDGIIMDLLAAEITAKTGRDPGEHYAALEEQVWRAGLRAHGCPGQQAQKQVLAEHLSPEMVEATKMAGDPIHGQADPRAGQRRRHRRAEGGHRTAGSPPGHQARKRSTRSTPRASAARNTCAQIQTEAQAIVGAAFKVAGL